MNLPFAAENLPFASAACVKFHLLSSILSSYYFIAECIKRKKKCVWGSVVPINRNNR